MKKATIQCTVRTIVTPSVIASVLGCISSTCLLHEEISYFCTYLVKGEILA